MKTLFPIVGQQHILEMLHLVVETERIANAYLFHGPAGTGKEAMALEFAALMNCQSDGDRPCGVCQGCKQMRSLQHPNLQILFALPGGDSGDKSDPLRGLSDSVLEQIQEAILTKSQNPYRKIRIPKAQNIKISSIRAMQKRAYLGRAEPGRNVVLIFEAERMNTAAFNSILKIVEEPPMETTFVFCTDAVHLIPETIRSRCQMVSCRVLTDKEIHAGLKLLTGQSDADKFKAIARLADGDFGFALSLAEQNISDQEEAVIQFIRSVMQGQGLPIKEQVDHLAELYKRSPLDMKRFLRLVQLWFRDAKIWSETEDRARLVFQRLEDKIQRFVDFYPAADYESVQAVLENAVDFIERNVYIRLALFSLQVKLHLTIQGKLKGIQYGSYHRFNTNRFR